MTAAIPASINREIALLAFNRRVLALAEDPEVPLLERLRFLCIVGGNLDEFFEIRMSGLKEQLRVQTPPAGLSLTDLRGLILEIGDAARHLIDDQYDILNRQVLPELAARGVRLLHHTDRTEAQRAWVAEYFGREVRPLLTPIGLDPAHPFPQVVNKSLNFVLELGGRDAFGRETTIAIVKAPRVLPRVIKVPPELADGGNTFVLLTSVIHAHVAELFPGRELTGWSQFRVTRNSDLVFDEDEVKNLRQALQGELVHRQFGLPLRLEVAANCPAQLAQMLLAQFDLAESDLYRCDGPVNIMRLSSLIDQVDVQELKYPAFTPRLPVGVAETPDILATIREHDILLHHPYQSFEPVVEFIRCAARDPEVVTIKQTVYRTGVNSVLMEALIDAAKAGKEVIVVIELMARFDEEANINWAERLEQAGAQVVYGLFGLKTHAKLALLLRREHDATGQSRLVPYAHLGTGNYHPRTARLYTDFGLLTADPDFCADVIEVFLHITSLAKAGRMKRLMLAPFTMHRRIIEMIRREARHAADGKRARIIAKMNALLEEGVIRALYAASNAGVKIDLIVRGACALRPGVPGLSENIRVRSILGQFLEHHRVWYFENSEAPDVWLSSADWMGRNLFRRVEVAFPICDPLLRKRVVDEGLHAYLADNVDAWELRTDGQWTKVEPRRGRQAAIGAGRLARTVTRNPTRSVMDLVLWRHCEAEPGEPDLGRRLTPKGQKQAERLAAWLDARLPDTARILVSPADRAQQTAVALQRKFRTIPELAPGANVAAVLAAANWPESREPVLIVGHQPTLGGGRVVSARGRRSALVAAQRRRVVAVESREGKRGGRCVEGGGRTRFRVTL